MIADFFATYRLYRRSGYGRGQALHMAWLLAQAGRRM